MGGSYFCTFLVKYLVHDLEAESLGKEREAGLIFKKWTFKWSVTSEKNVEKKA